MVKLKELRKLSSAELETLGNDSPLADVDFVLTNLLRFQKSDLIFGEKVLGEEQEELFFEAMERLKQGEPVQYVVGGCEFMSLWFRVNSATLIPRADTEILVEEIIGQMSDKENVEIFEIGTGSGCIAVSLAYYLKSARVTAVDISKEALRTATENAKDMGVGDICTFLECDIMKGFPKLKKLPDVVVSNPPYIPKRDILDLEKKVKEFEPLSALDGGEDGLDFYRRIAETTELAPGGILAFEVGIGQAEAVADIMKSRFCDIEIKCDLAGIKRVVVGRQRF